MLPPAPVTCVPLDSLLPQDLDGWAQACAQRLEAGDRMLTLWGRPAGGERVVLTAVLQDAPGHLRLLRADAQRGAAYPSLTARCAALQMLERELWEQTGVEPLDHPWRKPVRYEGARQQQMHTHPFFVLRGPQVHEVGVGPIHAGVIEPGHFRFMCLGEQVHHLEIQLGYQHRGVEAALLQRPPLSLTPAIETVAGDSSIAYAWAYCSAVEALGGIRPSAAAGQVRGIALELERIAMHLATLAGLATDIAFLQGGATLGRLRTAIINATMRICGSRFGRGWLRPGGVRQGLDAALRQDLARTLEAFARDFGPICALMVEARSVRARFQGVGVVTTQAALDLGLVGLVARASGVADDARVRQPGSLYAAHPVAMRTESGGDCWARMHLRMREIDASVHWIGQLLQELDDPAPPVPPAQWPLLPNHLCVAVQEGFRGPVVLALETGADGRLLHLKLQDPSLHNWFGLAWALRGNEISDFPICNKSFDLSYCGNDL